MHTLTLTDAEVSEIRRALRIASEEYGAEFPIAKKGLADRIVEPAEAHDECEFGCASDAEHLERAYDALRKEYDEYRLWVRTAFTHNIEEADAKKIASRYVWHMTLSGGGLRNSALAMQQALSEFIKLRVEAAHAAVTEQGENR